MGNPNSKSSFRNNSLSNEINFVASDQFQRGNGNSIDSRGPNDVLTKFTWSYGGNKVSLTGTFNKWLILIPIQKNGEEFSITLQLPRGVHQYKFIVDGEWRFSPEDPTMPDNNGHINNYIDTTNYEPLLQSNRQEYNYERKKQISDRPIFQKEEQTGKNIKDFNKIAPKLPPHYEYCQYLRKDKKYFKEKREQTMEEPRQEEKLTQQEIQQLFKTPHCLPMPTHVTLDHIVLNQDKDYSSMTITQRFKEKYTTFTHYSIKSPN